MNETIYNLKRVQLQSMLNKSVKDYDKIAEWTRVIRLYEKIKGYPEIRQPLRRAKRSNKNIWKNSTNTPINCNNNKSVYILNYFTICY